MIAQITEIVLRVINKNFFLQKKSLINFLKKVLAFALKITPVMTVQSTLIILQQSTKRHFQAQMTLAIAQNTNAILFHY